MGDTSAQLANGLARLVNSYLAIIPSHHHIALLTYLSVRSDIGDPAGMMLSLDFRSRRRTAIKLIRWLRWRCPDLHDLHEWRGGGRACWTPPSHHLCLFSMWRRLHLYCKRQVEDPTCMKHCTSSIQLLTMLTCRFQSKNR